MSARDLGRAAFLIVRRKAAATRSLPALFAGFCALLGLLWGKDSFGLALRAFLLLFPYFFLFLSQDLFHDEIASGALENVIFVNGRFREYLQAKLGITAAIGLGAGLAAFAVLTSLGFLSGAARVDLGMAAAQFLVGLLAGLYYLLAGGCLSFFFRAGANVVVVVFAQIALAAGFFLSMTSRQGWVEEVLSDGPGGLVAKLRFLGLSLVFPNAAVVRRQPLCVSGLALAAVILYFFAKRRIRRLELYRI